MEIHRYAGRLQVLRALDQAILTAQSAEEIADVVLGYLGQLLPYRWASVSTFDYQADEALVLAAHPAGQGQCLPIEGTWPLNVLQQGRIHVTEVASSASPLIQAVNGAPGDICVSVPLVAKGELTGVLNLGMESTDSTAFEEMDVAHEVADQLAIGIQQARLYEQLERHADELEDLVARRTAKLRTSEERFRAIFERAAIGIALLGKDGQVIDSNPALREMLGYKDESLHDHTLEDFILPDVPPREMTLFQELIAGKRNRYRLETRLVRRDGQQRWAVLVVSLVPEATDRPALAIGMIEDITEQKEAQEALIRAEKLALAGKMAASLAHEINNPLQSVIGYLGLAQEILDEGGDVSRHVRIALEELRRVATNVAQLRDLSRPSVTEDREPTQLNTLVQKTLLLHRNRLQNWGVNVAWEPDLGLPLVKVVPDLMQQVFLNLILNAIEAMPNGGQLHVRTGRKQDPPGVTVEFADSGVGVPISAQSRLFDAFYTTKPEGLGLGLYVSQTIIEDHGGQIQVESVPGKGTTFTVWMPTEAVDENV